MISKCGTKIKRKTRSKKMVAIGDPLPEQGDTGKLLHDTQEYAGLCALSTNPTRDRVRCELEQISYLLVSDFCELTGRPDCTSPSPPSPSSCPPWPSEPSHNANSHVSSSARLFPLSGQDLAKISYPLKIPTPTERSTARIIFDL